MSASQRHGGTRLVVFGASGGTGRLVVARALDRGYTVTAVARHLDALNTLARRDDRLALRPADVHDGAPVRAAAGHDVAISTLGGRGRRVGTLYSAGTRSIVDALEAQGARRFICVSSGGVNPRDPGLPLWYRLAIPLFFDDLYRDTRLMENTVTASTLAWTIVRASQLIDKPARGRFRVQDATNPRGGWRISRADLAEFLLDQVTSPRWRKAHPTIAY